ncbi:YifB family Mg chelatase-like AAA ATPase [Candidatus Anaplasma sp. TIGMIC]|uniref:YifB family Mg chelatase-like AAA ATPase n=1 Tax=Candidatus Anaplasma sp. TIGMIC TaxID=3020713 RepID=UPI00232AE9E8|nr:YifB family Mg chelatase-like AAA ATPase [Candidatus Anaplasma sp. TIGMIC]MDB1135646.1 YifB family Mg chelatase-like AAA ATPase [Candidatus Anaplasma sp. TIGMIC]
MLADINTVAYIGVCTVDVVAQVHMSNGIPAFNIVGMPDKIVGESRERIRAALASINAHLPPKRITVNLSPAGILKEGSHYDLPIAIGILSVMKIIKKQESLRSFIVLGELSLDGSISSVSGVLAAAALAKRERKGIICPYTNSKEAALVGSISVIGTNHLLHTIKAINESIADHALNSSSCLVQDHDKSYIQKSKAASIDMSDIIGQEVAKRAAFVAAAGGHNFLMVGPPGTGKSMIAKSISGILPDLSHEEVISINVISSITHNGLDHLVTTRPFREPHSSASMASMIGGGNKALPGEITLAHNGILFLDELPEFGRATLEALRQPMEDRKVVISRANAHVTYPANFQLIAAMNPCRCGYLNDPEKRCKRAPQCAQEYQGKISGPIMSRIDIKVEVAAISAFTRGLCTAKSETSEMVRCKVIAARKLQKERYGSCDMNNASLTPSEVESFIVSYMTHDAKALFSHILETNKLSNRDSVKILKVARTISDIEANKHVLPEHIAEAMSLSCSKVFCI